MFSTLEWNQLVSRLQEKTKSGTLTWKASVKTPLAFQAYISENDIVRLTSVDNDGTPPYRVTLFRRSEESAPNEKKKFVRFASVDSEELDTGWSSDILTGLYEEVVRIVNGVDEYFHSLMKELGEPDASPHPEKENDSDAPF